MPDRPRLLPISPARSMHNKDRFSPFTLWLVPAALQPFGVAWREGKLRARIFPHPFSWSLFQVVVSGGVGLQVQCWLLPPCNLGKGLGVQNHGGAFPDQPKRALHPCPNPAHPWRALRAPCRGASLKGCLLVGVWCCLCRAFNSLENMGLRNSSPTAALSGPGGAEPKPQAQKM